MNEKSQSTISLLNAIIESTADGILVVSNDGRVLRANKKFQKLWKIPDSLLQLKDDNKLLDFILDQLIQPELFIKKVQELYSNPDEESYDEITFKDGRIYERYSTSYKMENNTLGRVWSFRDVTEQKRTEETLRKERILFRTIIDNLPDAIYAKDFEFKKTLANTADIRNMGAVCEAEVLGKTDFEFFAPESAQAFYNDDKTIVDTGKPVLNREESFTDKEGHRNWLLTTKLPLIDSTGKITGIIGVGRDITLRKKNELIREALYDIS
ncbi:MAG: PAS domain-containing protein, partial [Ignavibacteria bacterium]|nr:PAS domain-containing protein [Ignavibacteria bacterium]